ncbi:MAG TPA: hypothetical protein DDY49_05870 [Paenibacillaceae bacterium]|nr:hypothetical protein [Paenibacillaceae bacterium]
MNHELFINFEHQKRFLELRQQLNADLQMDHNWLPLIFLMAGNKEVENVLLPHMDLPGGKFDDKEIKDPGVLLKLAIEFYTGENALFVNDLTNLNRRDFDLALAAIRIKHKISWYTKERL